MIDIDGLRFRYRTAGTDAIRNLSLHVETGSLFGLLGPNGSGKTTLISLLTGLLPAANDTVRIDGQPLNANLRAIQHFSALVPQDYAFYSRLTVRQNLDFFAGALGLARTTARERIREVIDIAGLAEFAATRAEHLSGGLKRRLNLAIGLLNQPRLLFLDEPTVGIDPQSRHFILDAIARLNADGTTVVYTTHYMEEVEQLCDDIAVLDNGRLLAHDTLDNLLGSNTGQHLVLTLASEPGASQREALSSFDGLKIKGHELRIAECSDATLKQLLTTLDNADLQVARIRYGHGNLEELFLHLTGRGLRD